jgi:hypothetical protein
MAAIARVFFVFFCVFILLGLATTSDLGGPIAIFAIGVPMSWYGARPLWWRLRSRTWRSVKVEVLGSDIRHRTEVQDGRLVTRFSPEFILRRVDTNKVLRGFCLVRGDFASMDTQAAVQLTRLCAIGEKRKALVHPGYAEWLVLAPYMSLALWLRSLVLTLLGAALTALGIWLSANVETEAERMLRIERQRGSMLADQRAAAAAAEAERMRRDQLDEQTRLATARAAATKAAAWAKFYRQPRRCVDNPPPQVLKDCASEFAEARRAFDASY